MEICKKIAIVGAGLSGIVSIKICKEENFQVTCYEITDGIGGLWNYREENIEGVGSVYLSTVMNTSKETSAFSDFPPPESFPNYMPHNLVLEYVQIYAKKNLLLPNIRFNRKVISVIPSEDYEISGKWRVATINTITMKEEENIFDAVLICTGHHSYPRIPSFVGQNIFSGGIIHSHDYKTSSKYTNKTVLIVGCGNSALDIAVDLCGKAKSIYLSCRSGTWVMPRVGPGGQPFDTIFRSRLIFFVRNYLPQFVTNKFMEFLLNRYFSHELYGLKPKIGFINGHPSTNDLLSYYIINGLINVKGGIKAFVKNGVKFLGEESVTPVDDIIFATGYNIKYPFLGNDINILEGLYKEIIPPELKHPNLAFIGSVQLLGSLIPIVELQTRWFVQILKGNIKLPSKNQMRAWIHNMRTKRISQFGTNIRYSLEVNETYMDELADEIGAKPSWIKMFLLDPVLYFRCIIGPFLPYQYRLQGPHTWTGAREAILKYRERFYTPFYDLKLKNFEKF